MCEEDVDLGARRLQIRSDGYADTWALGEGDVDSGARGVQIPGRGGGGG